MEDWHDYASVVGGSIEVAGVVAFVVSALIYVVLRLLHVIPPLRKQHTWRTDLRPLRWVGPIVFVLVFLPSLFLGWLFSGTCGTSNSEEFRSPDNQHKIVVYAFDCGATTDFSLVVSLLKAQDHLPEHRRAPVLYSHYHQQPITTWAARNFEVIWQDSHHALVRVEAFDGKPLVQQDGVSVRFEPLR